jgi:hypothetical protein
MATGYGPACDRHGKMLRAAGISLRVRQIGEKRKRRLAWALRERHHGIALHATYDGDGAVIYEHACTLGCEGIVSKRLSSPYRTMQLDPRPAGLTLYCSRRCRVRARIAWTTRCGVDFF